MSDRLASRAPDRRQPQKYRCSDPNGADLSETSSFLGCYRRMERSLTHIDSHKHAHRQPGMLPLFQEWTASLGVPLRDDGGVWFVGGSYAQWKHGVTELDYVGVPFLLQMLREEVLPGWTEISCHPGYRSPDFDSIYLAEREAEVATLIDPVVKQFIETSGIRLVSYADRQTRGSDQP